MSGVNKSTYRSWRWTILSVAFLIGVLWLSWPRETPRVDVTPDNTTDVAREEDAPLSETPSIGPLPESNTAIEPDVDQPETPEEDEPAREASVDAEDSKFEYFTATIEGRVTDSTGALVPGAVLQGVDSVFDRFPSMREADDGMPRPPPANHGAPEEWGTADDTGFYRIKLSLKVDKGVTELDISMYAMLADWSARSEDAYFHPLRAGETVTHDFVINLPGAVVGRIVDELGMPVEGISLNFHLQIGIGLTAIVQTDADGRFEANRITPGIYRIALNTRAWRFASASLPFTVKAGETLELRDDLVLKRVTSLRISLTCDQDPAPWAGERDKRMLAEVSYYLQNGDELSTSEEIRLDGTIMIFDPPTEGVTDVRVVVPGFEPTGWFAVFLREGEVNEVSFHLVGKD